jgi:MFS transporter, DHA2 family, multidrug resistance protein
VRTELSEPKAGRKEWIGLGVIALPCVLYSMDLTVLNLALPRISAELEPSSSELLWIVDIYGFLVAGCLITMGNLGDRIGRRRLLLAGSVAFGLASILAAFSTSAEMLIVARAVLGVAGATLAPSTLSLIRNMFLDPEERSLAIGVWISSYTVGGALGPVLGGFMLYHFWWGSVFLLAVPVMLLLLVLGPLLLPEYKDSAAKPLDVQSALLSLIAVLSVIYGMKHIAEQGVSALSLVAIAGGLVVATLFGRRQRRLSDPLIDLRLFRVPAFSTSLATFTLGTLVVFGAYIFIGQYLQLVLGLSPMEAGLWLLPSSLGFIVGSMLAPALGRRVRPALVMGIGLAIAAGGFALLAQVERLGLPGLVAAALIYSLGLAPVFTLGTDLIVGSAPPERAGAAAAMSETASEFGGALGIATLGSFGSAIYRSAMADTHLQGVSAQARDVARDTLGGAAAAAARLPDPLGAELLQAARDAFSHAFTLTVSLCALLAASAAIVSLLVLRRMDAGRALLEPAEAVSVRDGKC